MKIAVTGHPGQVASALDFVRNEFPNIDLCLFPKEEWDITNKETTLSILGSDRYHCLINAAAYTHVDQAEDRADLAQKINTDAVGELAMACNKTQTRLIQISTDYVYHNGIFRPLKETDPCHPQSMYAQTKYMAEKKIRAYSHDYTIIRTSWIYSPFGPCFPRTMYRLLSEGKNLKVIQDQWGCPTSAIELARVLLHLATENKQWPTLMNYTEKGWTNWYEMAKFTCRYWGLNGDITPITTWDYPTPAKRPPFSILECRRFDQLKVYERKHWTRAMEECFEIGWL